MGWLFFYGANARVALFHLFPTCKEIPMLMTTRRIRCRPITPDTHMTNKAVQAVLPNLIGGKAQETTTYRQYRGTISAAELHEEPTGAVLRLTLTNVIFSATFKGVWHTTTEEHVIAVFLDARHACFDLRGGRYYISATGLVPIHLFARGVALE